jgi:hypothetical protein
MRRRFAMVIAQLGTAAFSRLGCNTVYIVRARVLSRGVLTRLDDGSIGKSRVT